MWRYGTALADDGWRAEAVDLRGHGTAPRALDYTLPAYAGDAAHTAPAHGGPWDLVIAHSLGGAAAVLVAARRPGWTRRLVLVDPAIRLSDDDRAAVRAGQEAAFADPSIDAIRAANPTWHDLDVELKALATQQASRWSVEQTSLQNAVWDVSEAAASLTVPTHVIAADPQFSIFLAHADEVQRNPQIAVSVVEGGTHSPHRDHPVETLRILRDALSDEEAAA